jgi:hypothetical protein
LAAIRANVQVTFSVAMSNHHHTGIHDPDGKCCVSVRHLLNEEDRQGYVRSR